MSIARAGTAVLFVSLGMMLFAVASVIAQPVEVWVNAPEYVGEGDTFVVTIDITEVADLNRAQFELSFHPDVVKVSDVKDGKVNDENLPLWWNLNSDGDTIIVVIMVGIEEIVSGSGYLAEVEFEVKGNEEEKSELNITKGVLSGIKEREDYTELIVEEIPANWHGTEVTIGTGGDEEEDDEEEDSREVTPGTLDIIAWRPVETVVDDAAGGSRTFNISANQMVDISWRMNDTEVQTNKSTREAVYTNTSAVAGEWNVSAIATNTTTGLSDVHTWVWRVTLTATVTPTPTPAPKVTTTTEAETEETPVLTSTPAPGVTPTPTTSIPSQEPEEPGFEAVLAIAVMSAVAYILLWRRR